MTFTKGVQDPQNVYDTIMKLGKKVDELVEIDYMDHATHEKLTRHREKGIRWVQFKNFSSQIDLLYDMAK